MSYFTPIYHITLKKQKCKPLITHHVSQCDMGVKCIITLMIYLLVLSMEIFEHPSTATLVT